jgi:hypothetical protein
MFVYVYQNLTNNNLNLYIEDTGIFVIAISLSYTPPGHRRVKYKIQIYKYILCIISYAFNIYSQSQ